MIVTTDPASQSQSTGRTGSHSVAAAPMECLLQGTNLVDEYARIGGASLDPEEVRMVTDVAEKRALLALSVELDEFPWARALTRRAILAGLR